MKLPESWPTEKMKQAGAMEMWRRFGLTGTQHEIGEVFKAMILEAPTQPAQVVCKDPSAMCEEVGCKLDCKPAQEDKPVYQIQDGSGRYIEVQSRNDYQHNLNCGYAGRILYTRPAQEELTNTYVQPVPDKCDRIVWRGFYYHLPIQKSQEDEPVAYVNAESLSQLEVIAASRNATNFFNLPLYTHPADDKLRKAAEEARAIFNDIDQQMNRIMDNLRAALESK